MWIALLVISCSFKLNEGASDGDRHLNAKVINFLKSSSYVEKRFRRDLLLKVVGKGNITFEGECHHSIPLVSCEVNHCDFLSCPNFPTAECHLNLCGKCEPVFYFEGKKIDCYDLQTTTPTLVDSPKSVDDHLPPCFKERKKIIQSKKINEFIVDCELNGSYKPIQCWPSVGVCWCVNSNGEELFGTRKFFPNKPSCENLVEDCRSKEYGCCQDNKTAARGLHYEGCSSSVSKCEKLRSLPMHFNFSFRPQCDDNGYFNSVQCWDALNQCWCVNKDGLEIKGSRVNGKKPDCSEVICEDKSNDCHKVVVVPKFCLQLNHYAKDYCRKSCGYCPVTCEDKSDDCKEFLKVPDFCAQLNQYAKEYCRKSCGYCSVYLSTTETESQKLENMEKENITESNILNFTNVLNGIVHSIEFSDITSVNSISNLLTKVINGLSLTEDVTLKKNVTSGILFSINSLLGANISLTANTNQTFDLSSKFLNIIDYLGKQQTANLSISLKNLGMASYNTKTKTNPILISSTINENIIGVSITSGESDTSEILKKKDYIFLPLELFLEQKEIQVYSFIFKDKTFFKETSGVIDSVIISVTLFNNNITKYNSPIQMKFSSNSMASGKRKCHFYIIEEQRWSSEGCKTTSSSLAEVFCQCNHLTNFALLLDVDQSGNNPLTLSTITWVGCSLSIVGLFITIMSYSSFAQLRKKLAPKILIILCINLVTSLILFLALVERTKPRGLCQGTASLLQFFILSTFFWMAIEGFNLYRMCVNVFGASTSSHRLLLKCSAFGWGIPLVITAITSLSKPDYLGPSSDNDIKICVVRSLSFYLGILLPVCVVMAANIFILVSVLRGIDQNTIMHNKNKNKKKVKMAFAFSLLLGTTWLFAVLAVGKARDIYQWLFCIFNSLQGFFIFVVYTAQNKKVREQWMLFFLKIINGMFNKLGYNSRKLIISSSSSSSNILTSKLTFSANLLQANSGSFKENKL